MYVYKVSCPDPPSGCIASPTSVLYCWCNTSSTSLSLSPVLWWCNTSNTAERRVWAQRLFMYAVQVAVWNICTWFTQMDWPWCINHLALPFHNTLVKHKSRNEGERRRKLYRKTPQPPERRVNRRPDLPVRSLPLLHKLQLLELAQENRPPLDGTKRGCWRWGRSVSIRNPHTFSYARPPSLVSLSRFFWNDIRTEQTFAGSRRPSSAFKRRPKLFWSVFSPTRTCVPYMLDVWRSCHVTCIS